MPYPKDQQPASFWIRARDRTGTCFQCQTLGRVWGLKFEDWRCFFLELLHETGSKSGPSSKEGWLERTEKKESGKPEATQHPVLSGLREDTLGLNSTPMFKTEHRGRKSEDAFLLFELACAEQRASIFEIFPIPSYWVPAWSQIHRRQICLKAKNTASFLFLLPRWLSSRLLLLSRWLPLKLASCTFLEVHLWGTLPGGGKYYNRG